MKKYIHQSIVILASITIALLTGCQSAWTSGPRFHDVKAALAPKPGKGLVIFYFKSGFWGGGPNKWSIYANDQLLTHNFRRGTFYAYQADPGELRVFTKRSNLVLGIPDPSNYIPITEPNHQIEANQTYYIESTFWGGAALQLSYLKFKQVSKEEGEKGIKDCKWSNPS